MMVRIAQMLDRPPPSRLESWLARELQGGCLKAMPRYVPHGRRLGRSPERYARELLAALQAANGDVPVLERLKDDGRAFRSWTELVTPVPVDIRVPGLGRGLHAC